MHQLRVFSLSLAAFGAVALAQLGCGGSDETYYIPTDHQIRPFTAPEAEELGGDEDAEMEEPAPAAQGHEHAAPAAAPAADASSAKPGKAGAGEKAAAPGEKAGSGEKPASGQKKPKAKPGAGSP